ncbi:MAG TPA: AsmA family protein [Bryobacteraceae bacterium]|nr:AsmA family protein [Bryobacteraceae bacterium]
MRRLLMIGGCLILGVIILLGAALMFVDVNQFRAPIQSKIQARIRRDVKLGAMGLNLFPLSVRIGDMAISESPATKSESPFVAAKNLYVRVGLAALLHKQIEVDSIRLDHPSIELIRGADGKWNTADLGGTPGKLSNAPPIPAAPASENFTLNELRVEDGQLAITDRSKGGARTVYDHIDLTLTGYAPGKPFHLDGRVHMPQGDISVQASGSSDETSGVLAFDNLTIKALGLTATGQGQVRTKDTPPSVEAALKMNEVPIADLLKLTSPSQKGLTASGTISVSMSASGPANAPVISGAVAIPESTVNSPSLGKPLKLSAVKMILDHFAADLTGTGTIAAGSLAYDTVALTDVNSHCKFSSDTVTLSPVTARFFGGHTDGSITINTRATPPSSAVQLRLSSVDANQLLSALSPAHQVLFGTLSGSADLQAAPKAGQEFARGLNGTVQIDLQNGKISGVHLLNELASVAKFVGYNLPTDNSTNISKLAGTLQIRDGVGTTDNMTMVFDGGTLTAAGTLGLADQSLNLQTDTVLTKNVSDSVGGSKVGGWMSTVLANQKGELVVPATVTGTFSKPKFSPDAARMTKMKLGGIGAGLKEALDAAKPGSGQPPNPIHGLIDALEKKK